LLPPHRPLSKCVEIDFGTLPDVCLQNCLYLTQRILSFTFGVGHDAIGWDKEAVISHVRVVRCEKNTDVGCEAGEDESINFEIFEQKV
jgi:hypothetical protein